MLERIRRWWHNQNVQEATWWYKHWRTVDYAAMSFALFAIVYGIVDGSGISFIAGIILLLIIYSGHNDMKIIEKLGFLKAFIAKQQGINPKEIDAKLRLDELKKTLKLHKRWDMWTAAKVS